MTYFYMMILMNNNLTNVFKFPVIFYLLFAFSIKQFKFFYYSNSKHFPYVIWILRNEMSNFFLYLYDLKFPLFAYLLSAMHLYPPFWFRQRRRSILSEGLKYTLYLTQWVLNHSKYICIIFFFHLPWELCCHHKKWENVEPYFAWDIF